MKTSLAIVTLIVAISSIAFGDEIIFKNGDRLTGTIITADGGKITIKTAVAGEVKVDMKDVKTFTTDAPIELRLNDGSIIKDQIKSSETEGTVETAGTGPVKAQPLPLDTVKKINPPPVKWTGAITAGAILTRGNTDTDSVHAGVDAVRRSENDRITFDAGYLFGREKVSGQTKQTTIDNWFLFGQYDDFLTPKFYLYGNTRIEHDRIADLDIRVTPGVGVGYQWVERPDFTFSTEAGISWVYEEYTNDGSDQHVAARLAYHLDKKINDHVDLFHNLEFLPSLEDINDFNVNADAGVRFPITGNWFTEAKVEWRHDQTPAPTKDKDDLRYIVSLGWTF